MPTVVEMPRLSDTMVEGTLARWIVGEGASIAPGDEFAEIETDKAVQVFESFDEGVLLKQLIAEGDTVPLGTPIAVLGDAGEDIAELVVGLEKRIAAAREGGAESEALAPEPAPPAPTPAPQSAPVAAATPAVAVASASGLAPPAPVDSAGVRVKASPLARRIAAERGIDLTTVAGSGPQGRIIKSDLEGLDATRRVARGAAIVSREDTLVRATQMRKTIARRLVESKQGAPHFYLTMTVDCDRLVALRGDINASQQRVKVSYNDLVMRACVVALQDHPKVNAAWEGTQIRQFGGVHIGFAVALDGGLITPVVRDADQKSLVDMAVEVRDLAARARDGKLDTAEYSGNSFCVSNLGMYGIDHFTAIINPPAACIMAVGALRKEPVVGADGELTVGHRMTVTMSCDHRAVDGATGSEFLRDFKAVVERPLNLLL